MGYPVFATGDVLNASDMNAVGLWLVKTQTVGSGVSSVTVTGAFSSSYDNYLVTLDGGVMSAGTAITMKLSSNTAGCYGSYIYANYATSVIAAAVDNNAAVFTYAGAGGSDNAVVYALLFDPNKAKTTRISALNIHYVNNFGTYTGVDTGLTQHTAFTLSPFSGTMTGGTIRVYGMRN